MIIKNTLFNSTTDDVAIVIDLLRASTTITVALNKFKKVIPVNDDEKAFKIKDKYENVILAGEKNLKTIEGYDITNSPKIIQEYDADILVLNTTNGTEVLERIKKRNPDVKVLIGACLNAKAVAKKALELADKEIELVMAGRHEKFNIEDCVGAGTIIDEIVHEAEKMDVEIELEESALAAHIISKDKEYARDLIDNSKASQRLKKLGLEDDVEICRQINSTDIVPLYDNGEIKAI